MTNELKNKRRSVIPRPLLNSCSVGNLRNIEDDASNSLHDKTKSAVKVNNYIQGPFNPVIVGSKEKLQRTKHNSESSVASSKELHDNVFHSLSTNDLNKIQEKRKHNSASATVLATAAPKPRSLDDLSVKRNFTSEEKKRRSVRTPTDFSTKPDINFNKDTPKDNFKKPFVFSAKTKSQTLKGKYDDLVKEVTNLEELKIRQEQEKEELKITNDGQKVEISDLKEEINKMTLYCKDKDDKEKSYSETIETQIHLFNQKERKLDERLKCSLEKLQELQIDPISLKPLEVDNVQEVKKDAFIKAQALCKKLSFFKENNNEMICFLKQRIGMVQSSKKIS